ncbi:disks large-associated protein 5 isoform X3 [Trichomycterus rosablanca]|uniref:disks large-associated protein 5 isoform X3 n=1 Tax=Trichomycterus rosablanca TaxID=2290929 RepID=UPI002F35BF05
MDSRFAHLYKRDSSVSMIRVKMSRRRSQTQKENREKMQNLRRHLDQLPELEHSMDVSVLERSVFCAQETGHKANGEKINSAVEERKKMLARFKENKALQKEKEKREKKGTFKVGLYRPQPLGYLSLNTVAPSAAKTTEFTQSARVTRSTKQNQQPQPKVSVERPTTTKKAELATSNRTTKPSATVNTRAKTSAVEPAPAYRAPTTRSATRAVTAAKAVVKPAADVKSIKTRSANKQPAAAPSGRGKTVQAENVAVLAEKKNVKPRQEVCPSVKPSSVEEQKIVEEAEVTPASFAPQGFVFQPPTGLSSFQPTPLSPHSAGSFLSPSFIFEHKIMSTIPNSPLSNSSDPPSSPPRCLSEPSAAFASPPPSQTTSVIPDSSCAFTALALPAASASAFQPPASPSASVSIPPASPPPTNAFFSDVLPPGSPSASVASSEIPAPASDYSVLAPKSPALTSSALPISTPATSTAPVAPSSVSAASPPASPPSSVSAPPHPASPSSTMPSEPQHDVPYFRAIMASETERLTGLSKLWESRFDDDSIPEEMRDRMRTAVGQARLLIKERFDQFSGLVDDCDLGRGEKITTCTDLQGFWDMVYFQVEDVYKKFNALKEAEARGWQEETAKVIRQKKVVKKPPVAGGKTGGGAGASAAAKSRLAAVKAAMKAKKAAAEKEAAAPDTAPDESTPASVAPASTVVAQTVVFHGGFFQVESPVKVVDAVRRSTRQSVASMSRFSTPGKQRRVPAVSHSPFPNPTLIPGAPHTPASLARTPQRPADPFPCSPKPLHFSPDQHRPATCTSPNRTTHTEPCQSSHDTRLTLPDHAQSDHMDMSSDDPMKQSEEIKPDSSHCQSEEELALPFLLPEQSDNTTEPEENVSECSSEVPALSHMQAQEIGFPEMTRVSPAASPVRAPTLSFNHFSSPSTSPQVESMETCDYVPSSPSIMSTVPQQVHDLPSPPSDAADTCISERSTVCAEPEVAQNQGTESNAGLDFEWYLQPTACCSLSPAQSTTVDRFSLGLADAEMESPVSQAEETVQDVLMTPTAPPRMAPLISSWNEQLMDNPLLFTPQKMARVRQSVCEKDLMMFTPPSSK